MTGRIYYGTDFRLSNADRKAFNHGGYDCKVLLKGRHGEPVALLKNEDRDFPIWKVMFGTSCIVFGSYDEALDYCKGRFKRLDGRAL